MNIMDVRCPECDTLYEIDTRQLRGGASVLKCSQCEHIFHMQTRSALTQENQRRWMLRSQTSGDIRYFQGFDELHRWILQGVVGKQDDISRTGKRWKTLASIGEFMPIFQARESIASITETREKKPSLDLPPAAPTAPPPAVKPPAVIPPRGPAPSRRLPYAHAEPPARKRVETSRQFASAPAQNTAPHTYTPPTRTRTPISSKTWSAPPGVPHPTQTPTNPHRAAPKTRPPRHTHPAPDDEWSLGELPASLAEDRDFGARAHQPSAQHPSIDFDAQDTAPARNMTPIILTVLLVLGAGIALYLLNPPFVQNLLGPKNIAETTPTPDAPSAPAPSTPPDEVDLAAKNAAAEALAAQNEKYLSALHAAKPQVHAALAASAAKASKAAPKEPKPLSVNELLANAKSALDAGNSEQARKQYHAVLSRDRTNSSAITGLGWSLIALNSAPAAAAQFNKAIALNPSYGDAYIGLGKAKRDMGDHQGALDAYQTYLTKFPSGSKASIARFQADKLKLALGQ